MKALSSFRVAEIPNLLVCDATSLGVWFPVFQRFQRFKNRATAEPEEDIYIYSVTGS
jgi:hypothetical protein